MRTVTGLFDDNSDASAAVSALESAGVRSNDISIVSNNADKRHGESNAAEGAGTGAGIGAVIGSAGGLLTGLGLMAIPGVGPVVAAGWLAATAAGAAAGAVAGGAAGGIIGALTSSGVSERDAHVAARSSPPRLTKLWRRKRRRSSSVPTGSIQPSVALPTSSRAGPASTILWTPMMQIRSSRNGCGIAGLGSKKS